MEQEGIHDFIKQYPILIPEYIEQFEGHDLKQYVEVLFMLSSDDHVVIYLLEETLQQMYPILVQRYESLEGGQKDDLLVKSDNGSLRARHGRVESNGSH